MQYNIDVVTITGPTNTFSRVVPDFQLQQMLLKIQLPHCHPFSAAKIFIGTALVPI